MHHSVHHPGPLHPKAEERRPVAFRAFRAGKCFFCFFFLKLVRCYGEAGCGGLASRGPPGPAGAIGRPIGRRVTEGVWNEAVRLVWPLGPAGFPEGSGEKKQ